MIQLIIKSFRFQPEKRNEKMKYIINILIIFITIILITACFEKHNPPERNISERKMVMDLSGRWKFNLGDDPDWKEKNFDDRDWEKIYVPSSWENQGFPGYDGYAWYRTSFRLPKDLKDQQIFLVLGYVDDVDQTYINGKLIGVSGGFPPDYITAYNALRTYYIPPEYLDNEGENILAIRIYDDELDGGIISGKIGLYISTDESNPDINLSGVWDFKIGDDSLFLKQENPKVQSTKLMVPAHWDIQGFSDYDGFGWYKKTFFLPEKYDGENMILLLGKIDDIDQTFVNGILVGSTGIWNFKDGPIEFNKNDEYRIDRVYSVPAKILKPGKINTIVVRVYDGFRNGGIYEGPVGLITNKNYINRFKGNTGSN